MFGSTKHFKTCGKIRDDLVPLSSWALSQPIRRHFEQFQIEEHFYPHDLRRTGATMIAGLFGRRDFAAMALNHTSQDVTDVYDQYVYDVEKKLTLNALNKAIEIIVNSPDIESVPTFDVLRKMTISSSQTVKSDNHQGFQANFVSPVSYTLSYARDELEKLV